MKLQWYDDKDANWVDLDPEKYDSLDPKEKYRVYEASRFNIVFHGDQWDKSIMDSVENLSYWAGYYGGKRVPYLDNDQYYQGRMDGKQRNDTE